MPTYEYRCRECGHDFEVTQSFSDEPLTECPQCGGALRKVFGNVGIAFKGSGFYKTDSRSSSSSSSSSGASSSDSSSSGNGSSSDTSSSSSPSTGSSGSPSSAGSSTSTEKASA
jgi:putative FmdB family regulatory protein